MIVLVAIGCQNNNPHPPPSTSSPSAQPSGLAFVVDVARDDPDAGIDGHCDSTGGGCTLRAAIEESNENPGADTITFSVQEPILLSGQGPNENAALTGDLDVTDDLTVEGNGTAQTVVDATGLGDRVLDIDPNGKGIHVTLRGLTIQNGNVSGSGGGLFTNGALTLRDVRIAGSAATNAGGGVYVNTGSVDMAGVSIVGNHAGRESGGIANSGILKVTRSAIEDNVADDLAGGMWNAGSAVLESVTVDGNQARGLITRSQYVGALGNGGHLELTNVTIADNIGDPGGIHNGGAATLTNVTIAHNSGGIFSCCDGTIKLVNTLISDSSYIFNVNCHGTVVSLGHNLEDGASCGFGSTDLVNTDSRLGPLGLYGGATRTIMPLPGSPALDSADPSSCPATDQRGVARPQGSKCDIGALEALTPRFTVNSTADEVDQTIGDGVCRTASGACTLRAAVQETNDLPGSDAVNFALDGTFELALPGEDDAAAVGDLDVRDDLALVGSGTSQTVLDGGALDRVLDVRADANLTLLNVTVQNGLAPIEQGLVTFAAGGGLAIEIGASATVAGVVVRSNSATGAANAYGGGAWNGGDLTLGGVQVTDNSALADLHNYDADGGGLANAGALRVSDSTFGNNSAAGYGGGLYLSGHESAVLAASTFSGNTTGAGGGGLYVLASRVAMTNVTVSGNKTTGNFGGGVSVVGTGSARLDHVTLAMNVSSAAGAALMVTPSATLRMKGTIVAEGVAGGGCQGMVVSEGFNIDSGSTCGLAGPGDLINLDPKLGSLAANGGPTLTQALLTTSPAIDGAKNSGCPPPLRDQRGIQRPRGPGCDIGAVEE